MWRVRISIFCWFDQHFVLLILDDHHFLLIFGLFRNRLCPGLNTVIREVVMCLRRQYGVTETYGVPAGYRGFKEPESWLKLDEKAVSNLHNIGGSIL